MWFDSATGTQIASRHHFRRDHDRLDGRRRLPSVVATIGNGGSVYTEREATRQPHARWCYRRAPFCVFVDAITGDQFLPGGAITIAGSFLAEDKMPDENLPLAAGFEVRRRAYIGLDGAALAELPDFASDREPLVSLYRGIVRAPAPSI
jgi:hypothetical protein